MRYATGDQKEAVLEYIRRCEAVRRAEAEVQAAQERARAARDEQQAAWWRAQALKPPKGMYCFEGTNALLIGDGDYPELVEAVL